MLSVVRGALFGGRIGIATHFSSTRTLLCFVNAFSEQGWQLPRMLSETVGSEGTHDDFKPQTKDADTTPDVFETIKNDISTNKIFIYMKVGVMDGPISEWVMRREFLRHLCVASVT